MYVVGEGGMWEFTAAVATLKRLRSLHLCQISHGGDDWDGREPPS